MLSISSWMALSISIRKPERVSTRSR